MATIGEEMQNQLEQEKREKRMEKELFARMKAYEDIAAIKRWVIFFGILTIIGMLGVLLGLV